MFNLSAVLCLALFIVPLSGTFVIDPIIAIQDAAKFKEFLVLLTMFSIILIRNIKDVQSNNESHNYFLYGLIGFLLLSAYQSPTIHLLYGSGDLSGAWVWEANFWAFLYFMAYMSLRGFQPSEKIKKTIILSIGLTAILSSVYAYLQALGMDQAQFARPKMEIGHPSAKHITAMIGNPTNLGVWLAMCLPYLWIHLKKPWSFFVAGAILLTQSAFAIGGLIFYSLIILFNKSSRKFKPAVIGLAIILIFAGIVGVSTGKIKDNGRREVWGKTFQTIREAAAVYPDRGTDERRAEVYKLNQKNYSWTGRGLGSFPYIFAAAHGSKWESAHNEPLEIFYSLGLGGLVLFYLSVGAVLKKSLIPNDKFYLSCSVSFIYSLIASVGTPIYHVEPLRFFCFIPFVFLSAKYLYK